MELVAGGLIRQKYRIEKVLGEGGMGVVVAAWHLHLERRVAIKFLRPEMLVHRSIVERFLREGRAASAIEGEHVARVIDVDAIDDGTPFLVMEYLEGMDLQHAIHRGGPIPVAQAVGWVLEACEAVAEAHRLGIVHRDLKPANLFLATARDGRAVVKVLDFGISQVRGEGKNLTQTHFGMGSAEYMSPEQCLSAKDVDARTDIWALGVILYELMTRRVPYPGETATQVYAQIMNGPPAPAVALRGDLPPGLEAVILGCLERNVHARIPTVADLVARLAPFAPAHPFGGRGAAAGPPSGTLPLNAPVPGGGTLVLPGALAQAAPSSGWGAQQQVLGALPRATTAGVVSSEATPSPSRRNAPVIAVVGAALVIGAAGSLLILRRGEPASRAPDPAVAATAAPASATSDRSADPPATAASASSTTASAAAPVASAPPPAAKPTVPATTTAAARAGGSERPPPKKSEPAPLPAPKAGCSTPYVLDGAGHRQYKPECL